MKKKIKRKLLYILSGAVLLLLLLLILLYVLISPIAKSVALDTASEALGTPVHIEHLSINPLMGSVSLSGFSIATPEGYVHPDTFTLAGLEIEVNLSSLFSPTVIVNRIIIDSPRLTLEQHAAANNLTKHLESISAFTGPDSAASPKESVDNEQGSKLPRAVLVELLEINDAQINVANADDPKRDFTLGLEKLSLSMKTGLVELKEIRISNPDGYSAPNLFHLSTIAIDVDPSTLLTPQIVIRKVLIDAPTADIQETETRCNASEVATLLASFIPPPQEPPVSLASPAAEPDTSVSLEDLPVLLESLEVRSFALHLALPAYTHADKKGVTKTISKSGKGLFKNVRDLFDKDAEEQEEVVPEASLQPFDITFVSFEGLHIEPLKGSVLISGLKVGNPNEFANENLLELGELNVKIDPDTLQSDVMIVDEILLDSPVVTYEKRAGYNNVDTLSTLVENAADRETGSTAQTEKTAADTNLADSEQKLIINRLAMVNGKVRAKAWGLPTVPIPLIDPDLKDIGRSEGGIKPDEAAKYVVDAFFRSVKKSLDAKKEKAVKVTKKAGGAAKEGVGKGFKKAWRWLRKDKDKNSTESDSSE